MKIYREARARGCSLMAVTSGGELRVAAKANSYHLILLLKGLYPRHAIGYTIGFTFAVLRSAGCLNVSDYIRGFMPSLREFCDTKAAPSDAKQENW